MASLTPKGLHTTILHSVSITVDGRFGFAGFLRDSNGLLAIELEASDLESAAVGIENGYDWYDKHKLNATATASAKAQPKPRRSHPVDLTRYTRVSCEIDQCLRIEYLWGI